MQPVQEVKPGDRFALACSWCWIPGCHTVSGKPVTLHDGDIVTVADSPDAPNGKVWVCEPRLIGSMSMHWCSLKTAHDASGHPPCTCNIMIGPCRCGAFQREMAGRI